MRRLRDEPCLRVGAYVLHVYCKFSVNVVHDMDTHGVEFFGKSKTQAEAEAHENGWRLHRDGTSSCPACAGSVK